MKTLLLTLTYSVGIGELILAIYFWVTNSKSEVRRVVAFLYLVTGLWCVASANVSYQNVTPFVFTNLRLTYLFGIFIVTSAIHLVLIFPYPMFVMGKVTTLLLYLPAAIWSWIALSTNEITKSYISNPNFAGVITGGPLFTSYNIFGFASYLLLIGLVIYRFTKTGGVHKKSLAIVAWALIIGGGPAAVNDFLIYIISSSYRFNTLIANIITGVWIAAVTYMVKKA